MIASPNILLHYGEISLKGRNRPRFIDRLVDNIRRAMVGLPLGRIERMSGRLWACAKRGSTFDNEALTRLKTVFGLTSFAMAVRCELSINAIADTAWQMLESRSYSSLRVSARRAFRDVPLPSQTVNSEVGALLLQRRHVPVRMKGADVEVHVEIMPHGAYVYVDKEAGLGGLPVGVSGTAGCLLSGGIDSPVAAFRMQRRGLRMMFVHFHSVPFLNRASMDKAMTLAAHLCRYQGRGVLYLVPFGELQRDIVENAPAPLRVILYRRFMMRIAGLLARREGARGLVTGESLAQVASQTLANLAAINAAAPLPVLRPLIGFDKQEIISAAQALGTFETSILPDQDCCTLFMPREPETRAHWRAVEEAEAVFDVAAVCQNTATRAERHVLQAPWLPAPMSTSHHVAPKDAMSS